MQDSIYQFNVKDSKGETSHLVSIKEKIFLSSMSQVNVVLPPNTKDLRKYIRKEKIEILLFLVFPVISLAIKNLAQMKRFKVFAPLTTV